MANNHSIQLLRKNGTPTTAELNDLLPGQPLFDMTNNKLYIGKGSNQYTSFNNIGPTGPTGATGPAGVAGNYKRVTTYTTSYNNFLDHVGTFTAGNMTVHSCTIKDSKCEVRFNIFNTSNTIYTGLDIYVILNGWTGTLAISGYVKDDDGILHPVTSLNASGSNFYISYLA